MIAAALVGVVLLQRSEGGALGIGGGGGGFLTGRGTANLLTRTTAGLAAAFFVTSVLLSLTAQRATAPSSLFGRDSAAPVSAPGLPDPKVEPRAAKPGAPAAGGLSDKLPPIESGPKLPQVPQSK
jgi:preprotein translocase subunit SecG